MRTKSDRRNSEYKELQKRIKICKDVHCYTPEDEEYIKHKRDIPHSLGSNWWNNYDTKSMKNKRERAKLKKELRNGTFD